jgi:hypothetical protein
MVKVRDNQARGHAMPNTLPAFPGRWSIKEFAEFLSCEIKLAERTHLLLRRRYSPTFVDQ